MPPFENVLANKNVSVTPEAMTCGLRSTTDYCVQTQGIYRECDTCSDDDEERRHPPDYLTDVHTELNPTWWQSVTMLDGVHKEIVNLTVNLGTYSQSNISSLSYYENYPRGHSLTMWRFSKCPYYYIIL